MDWSNLLANVTGELFAPTTAAFALAAIGLNVHFGLTGLLNMGQAGFMLLGAYGFAISTIAGWPLWAAVLVAVACAVAFAVVLGIPTLKLRGDYLAIVTIAAAEIVRVIGRSTARTDLTGASTGLPRPRLESLLGRYGSRAGRIAQDAARDGDAPLTHAPDYSVAEIAWICRHEHVRRLEDLILRRTNLALLGRLSRPLLEELAAIWGSVLDRSEAERAAAVADSIEQLRERFGVDIEGGQQP